MKILTRLKYTLATLIVVSTLSPLGAQEAGSEVGKVVDIDGPRLYTDRLKRASWFQAYCGMPTLLRERLRTDKETQAVISFLVGGRAGLGRNTKIEIIGQRDVQKVGSGLRIDAGTFWAKFDRQDKTFEIRTAGGVIGIEGTELLSLIHISEPTRPY